MFQTAKTSRTTTKMKILAPISGLFLLFSFTLSYRITPIESSSGLLYVNLGRVKLTNENYTLLNYFNLTHIRNKMQTSLSFYYKTLALCSLLSKNRIELHCLNQLQYIENKLTSMKADYSTLAQFHKTSKRQKRGLINGIGDGFKFLFGMPDADDAKFYSDSIYSLVNNQKQTHLLMQQQVKVISSAITNFNHSVTELNKNTVIMNENLKSFNDFMSRTSTYEERLSFEVNVTSHILTLVEMTDEINAVIKNYLNSLTLIRHGIISLEILHPQDLLQELQIINAKHSLPLEPTLENAYTYFKIMKVHAFVRKELFIIKFELPLTTTLTYELFKIHSLPTPHRSDPKLFSYIEPSKPFILVSLTRTAYSMLNDLNECLEYLPEQWLCEGVSTTKRADQPSCEIQLFSKGTTTIPKTCEVKTIYADIALWHKTARNQWLYVLSNVTTLSILCSDSSNHEETLRNMGLLELDNNCKAYTDDTMLTPQSIGQSVNITHKLPLTDITEDDCCVRLKDNITFEAIKLQPMKLTNINLEELKFVQHKLHQFDEILQQQLNKPFLIKHTSWLTSFLAFLGGSVLLIILYNVLKWIGVINILKNYFCCAKEPRDASAKLKSTCFPCINIYNQSHNKRVPTPALVHYEAELQPLSYDITTPVTQAPSKISGRRSTRSSEFCTRTSPIRVVQD